MKSNFIILNGFDRSGSSAISRTLNLHPVIELIMQPFNSGFMRKTKHRAIEYSPYCKDAGSFFDDLANNYLNNNFIKSDWHFNHSSTREYIPGKLHLIKSTMNHFAQRYMQENYPQIDVWGIWRNPYEIINSILSNKFDEVWYQEAWEKICNTIKEEQVLASVYSRFTTQQLSSHQKLALILAANSHFFFYYLDREKVIDYEEFRKNPTIAFQAFSECYNLEPFNFNVDGTRDLNIIGKAFTSGNREQLPSMLKEEIAPIIEPLISFYKSRFN